MWSRNFFSACIPLLSVLTVLLFMAKINYTFSSGFLSVPRSTIHLEFLWWFVNCSEVLKIKHLVLEGPAGASILLIQPV